MKQKKSVKVSDSIIIWFSFYFIENLKVNTKNLKETIYIDDLQCHYDIVNQASTANYAVLLYWYFLCIVSVNQTTKMFNSLIGGFNYVTSKIFKSGTFSV